MDTSMYFWIIFFSVSGPVFHLLLQMNFQTAFWSRPCTSTILNEDCNLMYYLNRNKFEVSLLLLLGCEISNVIISSSPHKFVITNILTVDPHFHSFFKNPGCYWKRGTGFGRKDCHMESKYKKRANIE